jgi:hypothetical protein
MPPLHISLFEKLKGKLQTSNGKTVEIWELRHTNNNTILSAWAKHFRENYCKDSNIDKLCDGICISRKDFLNTIKFPDSKIKPGPSTRAGDFGEILVADFLEFIENYEVLSRVTRYSNKINRNSSPQGCDVIGFHFEKKGSQSPSDELAIYEAKAKFTGKVKDAENQLQKAIKDSGKDKLRIGESLSAMKQRFLENKMENEAEKVKRFQNEADNPYKTTNGAVALVCNSNYSDSIAIKANTNKHPRKNSLRLIIIKGKDMMALVHELYRRAADEA